MRYYPSDESDKKNLNDLNASSWQSNLLKLNPAYCSWGCYEDYMSSEGSGWDKRVIYSDWKKFKSEWGSLNDYNELVNFYFELYRKNHNCSDCGESGLNSETKQISDDWYDFDNTGRKWCYKITDVEVEALVKEGRLTDLTGINCYFDEETNKWIKWDKGEKVECEAPKFPTAEEVNKWASGRGIGHDAINKWICVEARAKSLGVYGHCEYCNGKGYIFDEPNARVALQLWMLHPRKGCSRGVYIENIEEDDLPEIFSYLRDAKERNNQRFEKIPVS